MSTDPRKGTKSSGNTKKQPEYDYEEFEQADSYYNNSTSDGKYAPSNYTQVKQTTGTTGTKGGNTAYSKMYDGGDYDDNDPSDAYYTAGGDYSQGGNYPASQTGAQTKLIPANSTTEKKPSGGSKKQ